MPATVLIDTDILIDAGRNHLQAVEYLQRLSARPLISAVTVAELYSGVRDGRERAELDFLTSQVIVVSVDDQIAQRGGLLHRQYSRSHGTGLADALIAATAEVERVPLVTLNRKHFPMLVDVLVPYARS